MIDKLKTEDFDQVYELMKMSFPVDEYRSYEDQKALCDYDAYTIYAFYSESGEVKAFIAVWVFDDFAFIEHFAVHPNQRNSGIGAVILNEFMSRVDRNVCLEVELAENEMASRRIGFYERNGFFLNDYPYRQPPLSKDRKGLSLQLMSSGAPLDEPAFKRIRSILYSVVYQLNLDSQINDI